MKHALVCIALMLAVTLTGCHKKKVRIYPGTMPYPEAPANVTPDSLYSLLSGSWSQWHDISVPVTVGLESPSEMAISGRATMVRDRQINLSLRAFGMEVAVIYADTDSIFLVDKYHKLYIAESMSNLSQAYGISLGNIQDILTGRAFMPGGGTMQPADSTILDLGRDGDVFSFTAPMPGDAGSRYTAWACIPAALLGCDISHSGADARLTYTGSTNTPCGMMASTATLATCVGGKDVVAALQWDLDQAKWDTGASANFTPPTQNKYRRIYLPQLLKSLSAQ